MKKLTEREVFENYLSREVWTLGEACFLLNGYNPGAGCEVDSEIDYRYNDLDREELYHFGQFEESVRTAIVSKKIKSIEKSGQSFLYVTSVIDWAIKNTNFNIYPDLFSIYKEKHKSITLKESQLDKIRCEAIAQALWHQDKEITLSSMVNRSEIKKYGNGSLYAEDTLKGWIKGLCPKPRPAGRPKKIL